jgi:alkylated DNA repair dioxygenase AlkB
MEQAIPQVPGLQYLPNYLAQEEHDRLLAIIDQQPWLADLKRRVQHYGYRYDYKSRAVDASQYLGPLPGWLGDVAERLHGASLVARVPDQVIINEYLPGQGISAHVDCEPCFGETVLSLTLGSSCVMVYTSLRSQAEVPLLVEPCSLVVMAGEARYHWKHAIPARKTDVYAGKTIGRGRRVSITLRTVIRAAGG